MKIKDNLGNIVTVPKHLESKVRRLVKKGDMKGVSALAMQFGGSPVNMEGYTPGAESFDNPFNIIPGGNITMKDTPFPVMGYPLDANLNVGAPRLMKPGTEHMFNGAAAVLEVPQKQYGGASEAEPLTDDELYELYLTNGADGLRLKPGTPEYEKTKKDPTTRAYFDRTLKEAREYNAVQRPMSIGPDTSGFYNPIVGPSGNKRSGLAYGPNELFETEEEAAAYYGKPQSPSPTTNPAVAQKPGLLSLLPTLMSPISSSPFELPASVTGVMPETSQMRPGQVPMSPYHTIPDFGNPLVTNIAEGPSAGAKPGQPPMAPHYTIPDMFNPLASNIEDGPSYPTYNPDMPLESTGISNEALIEAANSGSYGESPAKSFTAGNAMVAEPKQAKTMEDMLGEFYARYPQLFDKMRTDNEANYADSKEQYSGLIDKLRGYAGRQYASSAAGTIAQSPYTKPVLQDRGFADARREAGRMPQYLLDVQRAESEAQLRTVADTLRMQGARPSEMSSLLAPLYSRHVSGQNELAAKRFAHNAQADSEYYDFLTSLENANMASRTNNENAILAAQNQQIQQLADASTDYSKNMANLETMDVATQRGAQKEYTDNEYRTLLAEVGFVGKDLEKALEVLKTQRDDQNMLAASMRTGPLTKARDAVPIQATPTTAITPESGVVAAPAAAEEEEGDDLLESNEMPLGSPFESDAVVDLPSFAPPSTTTPPTGSETVPDARSAVVDPNINEGARPNYETYVANPELTAADRRHIDTYAGNIWEIRRNVLSPNIDNPGEGLGAIRYAQKGDIVIDNDGRYGAKGKKVQIVVRNKNGDIIYDARDTKYPPLKDMPQYKSKTTR
jgi:hypothetical protein